MGVKGLSHALRTLRNPGAEHVDFGVRDAPECFYVSSRNNALTGASLPP